MFKKIYTITKTWGNFTSEYTSGDGCGIPKEPFSKSIANCEDAKIPASPSLPLAPISITLKQ
jgi:hypothetical protein